MTTTRTTRGKAPTPTQLQSEITQLQKQVADLSKQIAALKTSNNAVAPITHDRPWMRIAATVAATFVLGRVVDRFRLGAAGATAVPMIAAQLGHRFSLPHFRR
jgi:hypothetical protein